MDKEQLQQYLDNKTQIKLNLKNNRFFTGIIIGIEKDTCIFKDKFNQIIPISLDSIAYIVGVEEGKNGY